MRILFLSAWFPFPPDNGSKLRIYHLLRALAARHQVTLLSFADTPDACADLPELRQLCQAVHLVPISWYNPRRLRARLGLFSLKPRSVIDTFSPQMAHLITQVTQTTPFDLVIASQTRMASYRPYFPGLPAIFEEVEVGVLYENFAAAATVRRRFRHGLTWWKHRRYLVRLLRQYGVCTVASVQEAALLQQEVGVTAIVVPNCIDVAAYAGVTAVAQPDTLIYTGSFSFAPNHEAMHWFVTAVWPLVLAQRPQARLLITGNPAGRTLPSATNVTHLGFVDDVRPYVAAATVSIAPLQTGGGTRLKILEAMALRVPVVATRKGAEGLNGRHEQHLLLADTPAAFAAAVVRLLQDAALRRYLAENAYQLAQQQYDWTVVTPRLMQLVEEVAHASH